MTAKEYRQGVSDASAPASCPVYDAGDVLIAKMQDGSFQVSRVSANRRSMYVMGCQPTEPAAMLGMEKSLGAVAPGYYADIVAVEGNPLADINVVIDKVRWVMKGGIVVRNELMPATSTASP